MDSCPYIRTWRVLLTNSVQDLPLLKFSRFLEYEKFDIPFIHTILTLATEVLSRQIVLEKSYSYTCHTSHSEGFAGHIGVSWHGNTHTQVVVALRTQLYLHSSTDITQDTHDTI